MTRLARLRRRLRDAGYPLAAAAVAVPLAVTIVLIAGIALGAERAAAIIVLASLALGWIAVIAVALRYGRRRSRARTVTAVHVTALDGPTTAPAAADPLLRVATDLRGTPLVTLTAFALAARSEWALDTLVRRATGFRFDAEGLLALLDAEPKGDAVRIALGRVRLPELAAVVRVLAATEHQSAAVQLASLAAAHDELPSLGDDEHRVLAEVLLSADAAAEALAVVAASGRDSAWEWLVRADALHPALHESADEATWLGSINAFFRRAGIEPVALAVQQDAPALDRLTTEAPVSVKTGPLISVIMSCYRPGGELRAAVASIVAQTWADWELLIIDDGSGADYDAILDEVAVLDARIRVIRASENAGTYVRRNDGLAEARGEFVTVHDSDDWAHPRRLELQVRPLLADEGLSATVSRSLRATSTLRFVQPRGALLRLTETSLMFRRAQAIELVGYYDTVRKAADTGYRVRLERASGRAALMVALEVPLTIVRFDATSLSGIELADGWMHPARVAYASAHRRWLDEMRARGEHPMLPRESATRAFPAPAALRGESPLAHALDIVVVLDPRSDPQTARRDASLDARIARWTEQGRTVGLLRGWAVARAGVDHTARESLQALINAGQLVELMPGQPVRARAAVVLGLDALAGVDVADPMADPVLVLDDGHPIGPVRTRDSVLDLARERARGLSPSGRVELLSGADLDAALDAALR